MKKLTQKKLLSKLFSDELRKIEVLDNQPLKRLSGRNSEKIYLAESALLDRIYDYESKIQEIKSLMTSLKRSISIFNDSAESCLSIYNRVIILYNTISESECTALMKRELTHEHYIKLENIIKTTVEILYRKRYAI